MPVITITNLTSRNIPVDSAVGIIPAGGSVTVDLKACELEETGIKLLGLEAANVIEWSPVKSDDVDDKMEFVPASLMGGSAKWTVGTGTPEAAVVGSVGDLYSRLDGGANTTIYVKESGNSTNTGWIAK